VEVGLEDAKGLHDREGEYLSHAALYSQHWVEGCVSGRSLDIWKLLSPARGNTSSSLGRIYLPGQPHLKFRDQPPDGRMPSRITIPKI
jgi:hypothetical protein